MPANFCSSCGRKGTGKRQIDQQTSTCADCAPQVAPQVAEVSPEAPATAPEVSSELHAIDDSETLNNISFGALKTWLTGVNASMVSQFETKLMQEVISIRQDLESTKTSLTETNSRVEKLQKDVADLKKSNERTFRAGEERTKSLEDETKQLKTVGQNNLKYLINLDRNIRREHIVIFGVPEDGKDLVANEISAKTDVDKCNMIFRYINVPMDSIYPFRLGKPTAEKVRPIKVKCPSSNIVGQILTASKKLKDLPNQTIYIKPDKTKSEVVEYQRLGTRKSELLLQYPTEEGGGTKSSSGKGHT